MYDLLSLIKYVAWVLKSSSLNMVTHSLIIFLLEFENNVGNLTSQKLEMWRIMLKPAPQEPSKPLLKLSKPGPEVLLKRNTSHQYVVQNQMWFGMVNKGAMLCRPSEVQGRTLLNLWGGGRSHIPRATTVYY
jgi:hypothetical protein